MLPPSSSLAPSSAVPQPNSGPTLRPRTPTQPRPGFVSPSPNLRVASLRPSPHCESNESQEDQSFNKVIDSKSDTTDAIDRVGSVEFLGIKGTLPKSVKKKKTSGQKAKVHVVKRRGRPRGSGASAGPSRRPSKKSRKAKLAVSSIFITFSYLERY